MIAGIDGMTGRVQDAMLDARAGSLGRIAGSLAMQQHRAATGAAAGAGAANGVPAGLSAVAAAGEVDGVRVLRSVESAAHLYDSARTPEEKKIKETADEFVSTLYSMLFKEMDKTVERTGLLGGGHTEEMFKSFVLDEYAKQASSQGSNNPISHRIYEMLYDANSRHVPPTAGQVLQGAKPLVPQAPES